MAAGGSDDDPSQRARLLAQAISEGINLLALLGSEAPFPSLPAPWDGSDPVGLKREALGAFDAVTSVFAKPPAGGAVLAQGFDHPTFAATAEKLRRILEAWDGRLPTPEGVRADARALLAALGVPGLG